MVTDVSYISLSLPAAQGAQPLNNGNSGFHPPEPNGHDQVPVSPLATPASAITPKKTGAVRFSRARYDAKIADLIVQPRSADAVLDAIEKLHPIAHLPHDLRRRAQIAGLVRRLCALGATVQEILGWVARFSTLTRI
jgi:hypothetical protein